MLSGTKLQPQIDRDRTMQLQSLIEWLERMNQEHPEGREGRYEGGKLYGRGGLSIA